MDSPKRPVSEYLDSASSLLGRLQFLYTECEHDIMNHPPHVAVSYIAEAIDSIRPHWERHERARRVLLGLEPLAGDALEEVDHG